MYLELVSHKKRGPPQREAHAQPKTPDSQKEINIIIFFLKKIPYTASVHMGSYKILNLDNNKWDNV